MAAPPLGRTKLRYRWNHRHPLHRAAVRAANRALPRVPFVIKYGVTDAVRRSNLPYRLLGPTSVAVQIGAPRDTLRSGRSRAMAFVRLTHPNGRVLVVEPDRESAEEFRETAERHGLTHATVIWGAAWKERGTLTLEIDPSHPATNFTAGSTDYDSNEMKRFHEAAVDAAPVDDLLDDAGITHVDLVSITTNGAEPEILQGLARTLKRDRPIVCLARTAESYSDVMGTLGYELMGDDDRGFTYQPRAAP